MNSIKSNSKLIKTIIIPNLIKLNNNNNNSNSKFLRSNNFTNSSSSSSNSNSKLTTTSTIKPIIRQPPSVTPTNLPGSNLPGAGKYSPTTVKLVTGLAKLFGYNSQTSTAIRTASDYYDRCAERGELEAPFFYEGKSLSIHDL